MKVTRSIAACLLMAVAAALFPANTFAQVSRLGETLPLWSAGGARGSDVAFDSKNNVYLVVSSFGTVRGRYVSADGVPLGAEFVIQSSGHYTHFPRVAYSPDAAGGAGAFLVTWHASVSLAGTDVLSRIVSYTAGLGTESLLMPADSRWETGAAVAYSTVSKEFLVVWQTYLADLRGVRVANTGVPIGTVPIALTGDGERDPNVAYNPATNEFLVVYSGWGASFAFVRAQRVKAGTGENIGAPTHVTAATGTYITNVAYNAATGQYLSTWYQPGGHLGRLINADGSVHGDIKVLSTTYAAYDALGLAYNATSGTFHTISHGPTADAGGVELAPDGTPLNSGAPITAIGGTLGNFYPRLTSNTARAEWMLSAAHQFSVTIAQRFGTATRIGSAPSSDPHMAVDTPNTSTVLVASTTQSGSSSFPIAGWALDRAAPSGTGVSAVHVWAFPVWGEPPTFIGAAALGIARGDVGNAFGAQFTNSGYFANATLSPGLYDVAVYAASTVTGTFNNSRSVRIQVKPAGSDPRMAIDTPRVNASVPRTFTIAGWAADLGAASGSGVDTIHVWAWPIGGGSPVFVGVAGLNGARPDVGNRFGPQFASSGYSVTGTLAPGTYDLAVYARSTVTGTFNNAQAVRVLVAIPSSLPRMALDSPMSGQTVAQGFTVQGWAIDQAAATGVGVDAIHVWAFPTNGGPAVFVGAAYPSGPRADVAAVYGAQFLHAGYALSGSLPVGDYQLVAYARSIITGTFNNAAVISLGVR